MMDDGLGMPQEGQSGSVPPLQVMPLVMEVWDGFKALKDMAKEFQARIQAVETRVTDLELKLNEAAMREADRGHQP